MVEWLAMPACGGPPTTLDDWAKAFSALGQEAKIVHDGPGIAWIEIPSERMRGYAVLEGGEVEAINFELRDAEAAQDLLKSAAANLGWELYQEDDDEDDST